ncbi:amino acid ABC transporter permease [Pseudotabrizicola algicola]|uniref:Amino acid ABC transporter permease n=1 Tax=Pseudotabrizicola algicola TaxID=2709381 RepID=A0A6B3RZA9_9RHOB|nr:amino acid ABC transporter permease [Pseudotabrizicola algicola]NEX48462.1 amino acid ABC transporter permease [Pseudotabrizicola algicola]
MNYNWNWGILFQQSLDGSGSYLEMLLRGLQVTLVTAVGAWLLALALGFVVGVMRTMPSGPAQRIASAYVELFRNIPFLVQLFLWYFVLPELLPQSMGNWLKALPNSAFWTTVLGLGFYMSARVAEQLRAGISSLPRGQKLAGAAIGLTTPQTYRYVLLPMAFRIILPPLTSEFLNTIKNTSVALTIGLVELTARARAMQEFTFQIFEAFTVATVLYLTVNILVTIGMLYLEHRVAVPGYTAGR